MECARSVGDVSGMFGDIESFSTPIISAENPPSGEDKPCSAGALGICQIAILLRYLCDVVRTGESRNRIGSFSNGTITDSPMLLLSRIFEFGPQELCRCDKARMRSYFGMLIFNFYIGCQILKI